MQRITKEVFYVGRKGNKIGFLVRAISSIKTEQGKINKLNNHIVGNMKVIEHKRYKDDDVLFHDIEDKGLITLNRPKYLNALNTAMCEKMIRILKEWESSKKLVIIKGNGDKAFCSGGDLNTMKDTRPHNVTPATTLFTAAYRLYYLVATYKVPIVVFMNNITMGGGAGISIHNKYKVVTERSIFAMPEAAIGFFLDAGCSYVFPRLQGKLGLFLGLTGYRLKGIDIIHSEIATHYVLAKRLKDLEQELLSSDNTNVDEILEKYRANTNEFEFSLAPYKDKIDSCFSADSVEEIIERLQNDGSVWSKNVTKILKKMSPSSLKIIHATLREGKKINFADCIKMEYRLSYSLVSTYSDFYEGYRIITHDKGGTPNWQLKSLTDVTSDNVLKRFSLLPPELELKLEDK